MVLGRAVAVDPQDRSGVFRIVRGGIWWEIVIAIVVNDSGGNVLVNESVVWFGADLYGHAARSDLGRAILRDVTRFAAAET